MATPAGADPGTSLSAQQERVERLRAELKAAEAELVRLEGPGAPGGATPSVAEVLDSLPVEIAVIDNEGVIRLVNGAWARLAALHGNGSDQVVPGANYLEVCRRASASGDAAAGEVLLALQEVIEGRRDEYVTEYPCHGPEGQRWYLMQARRLAGGGGLTICHVDISSRWKAEEALRLGHQRFEAALENSNVVVSEQDTGLRYTWIHNAALAFDRTDVLGRRDADLLERPEDAERIEAIKREAMTSGRAQREEVSLRVGGAVHSYDLSVHPRRDAAGAVVGVTCAAVDITERKGIAERLREGEARHRQLLDSMEQGFCIIEMLRDGDSRPVDYRFLEINARFERHTGLQGALGRTARELVPNLESRWIETYDRVARTGMADRFELASDAMGRVFAVEAVPVGPPGGLQVALLFSDITERRRSEGNLAFIAGLGNAFAPASTPGQIGQIAARHLMSHYELERVSLSDIDTASGQGRVIAGDHRPGLQQDLVAFRLADFCSEAVLAELGAGRPVFVEELARDPRSAAQAAAYGPWGVRSMALVPHLGEHGLRFVLGLFAGQPRRWPTEDAEFLREVAGRIHTRIERARAEAALQASESRLRLAAQTARFGVHDYDVLGDHDTWSDELYEINGVEPGTPVSIASVAQRIHPADQARVMAAMQAALDPRGSGEFDAEFRILRADTGELRWIYNRARTFFAEVEGRRRAVRNTGVVLDITERKRAEEHLRDDARRKDEFLAMLAHELRNPLAPIRSTVELMKRATLPAATLERCRDIIDRQSAQMARLLDDLLEMTRLARGDVNLRREPVPLHEVLELAVETSRPLFDARQQLLEVPEVQPGLVLLADRSRLVQVFANVLNNAAKYSHAQGRIELSLHATGRAVEVCVADDGIGIAPAMLDGLFELFFQSPEARRHAPGGLGLGLPLARRLVEMHGGTLRAESGGPGLGSRFVVRLPLHPAGATVAWPGAPAADEPLPRRLRVVVADDNVDAADTLSLLLESLGCEVRVAYGGAAALEACRSFRPGFLFVDLGMPSPDGYAVCERLRHEAWGHGVRVVAVSGWGREEDRRRTADTGFDHHLVKPVAAGVLKDVLRGDLSVPG